MKFFYLVFFVLFFGVIQIVESAFPYTEISGELDKIVSAKKSPYLVVSDIYIRAGSIVTIEPGTVFMFKNFTSFHIRGVCNANAENSRPIIFTSENDPTYNKSTNLLPTPFDWNGIYLHKDAVGSIFSNVKVQYSVKGIFSETKYIKLTNLIFFENGRSDFVLENEEKKIDKSPFTYEISTIDVKKEGVPINVLRDEAFYKRNILRYTSLTVAICGGIVAGKAYREWWKSRKSFLEISSKDSLNLSSHYGYEWEDKRDLYVKKSSYLIGWSLLTAAGLTGFVWSFTF